MTDSSTPLFSLLNGEGVGVMLGAAAGDVAGGRSSDGYSAITQQATIVAYHVMRGDRVDRPLLAQEWRELGADGENPSVYRAPSAGFRSWLAASAQGESSATAEPSTEPSTRVYPVGVWFRRDPDRLLRAAVSVARVTHLDASTVVWAAAVAGAVAACSFGQVGRDLLLSSAELAERALREIGRDEFLYNRIENATDFPSRLREAAARGPGLVSHLLAALPAEGGSPSGEAPLAAIALASDPASDPDGLVEAAASAGGSELASMVGAMIGARAGLRSWPWVVPNRTWFAEIGRRLASGNRQTADIPVPYQVEERLSLGHDSGER